MHSRSSFSSSPLDMQRPTHPRLHVRDARDAHTVFEAVRRGLLKPVERRLNEIERAMHIKSGAVFIWEESDDEGGLRRWTDSKIWSQSRMREPYLFYDERLPSEESQQEQSSRSPTYRFVDGVSRGGSSSSALSHYDRSNQHPMGLVKQAYSAWVLTAPNTKRRWHLTAYFTYSDLGSIPTVDQDPILSKITVPPGIYRSGKARSKDPELAEGMPVSTSVTEHSSNITSPSSSPPPANARPPMLGYASLPHSGTGDTGFTLPSLHSVASVSHRGHPAPPRTHSARPAEDQRMIQMLNSRHII